MSGRARDDFETSGGRDSAWLFASEDPYTIYSPRLYKKGDVVRPRSRIPIELHNVGCEVAASGLIDGISTFNHVVVDSIGHRVPVYAEMMRSNDPILAQRALMAAEKFRAVAAVARTLQQYHDDDQLCHDAAQMLWQSGIAALPIAVDAQNSIVTERFREELGRQIDRYRP